MIKQGFRIKGNVKVISRECFRGSDKLEQLWLKEIETGKSLLTPFQRALLDNAVVDECETNNLTMTSGIDRMVSLWGRCPGYLLNTVNDDRAKIANMLYGYVQQTAGTTPVALNLPYETDLLFPEIVGIGSGRTTPTISDTTLESDFNDYSIAPTLVTYRNTYNSKQGGILKANQTTAGYDFENDYICKCAMIYTSGEINFLQQPIWEIGLFAPKMQMGIWRVLNNAIDFSLLSNNRLWSYLNHTAMTLLLPETLYALYRGNMATNRTAQQVIISGVIGAAINGDPLNLGIGSFTPRWDSLAAAPGLFPWGNSNDFSVGPLIARVVLPVSFIKNVNFSLTILWQIYLERF